MARGRRERRRAAQGPARLPAAAARRGERVGQFWPFDAAYRFWPLDTTVRHAEVSELAVVQNNNGVVPQNTKKRGPTEETGAGGRRSPRQVVGEPSRRVSHRRRDLAAANTTTATPREKKHPETEAARAEGPAVRSHLAEGGAVLSQPTGLRPSFA